MYWKTSSGSKKYKVRDNPKSVTFQEVVKVFKEIRRKNRNEGEVEELKKKIAQLRTGDDDARRLEDKYRDLNKQLEEHKRKSRHDDKDKHDELERKLKEMEVDILKEKLKAEKKKAVRFSS